LNFYDAWVNLVSLIRKDMPLGRIAVGLDGVIRCWRHGDDPIVVSFNFERRS
jgi:hypothetical protein